MGGKGSSSSDDLRAVMNQQNELNRRSLGLQAAIASSDALSQMEQMGTQIDQFEVDKRDYTSQILSYDQWLGNYQNLEALQQQSQAFETAQYENAGKESYDNFINALGYADARAGYLGLVGAGTSTAEVSGRLDEQLVAFAGEDRSLAGTDGLYGMQGDIMRKQFAQDTLELQNQKAEAEGQKDILQESIGLLDTAITKGRDAQTRAKTEADLYRQRAAEWGFNFDNP